MDFHKISVELKGDRKAAKSFILTSFQHRPDT
jgi:hypothetical protein